MNMRNSIGLLGAALIMSAGLGHVNDNTLTPKMADPRRYKSYKQGMKTWHICGHSVKAVTKKAAIKKACKQHNVDPKEAALYAHQVE